MFITIISLGFMLSAIFIMLSLAKSPLFKFCIFAKLTAKNKCGSAITEIKIPAKTLFLMSKILTAKIKINGKAIHLGIFNIYGDSGS